MTKQIPFTYSTGSVNFASYSVTPKKCLYCVSSIFGLEKCTSVPIQTRPCALGLTCISWLPPLGPCIIIFFAHKVADQINCLLHCRWLRVICLYKQPPSIVCLCIHRQSCCLYFSWSVAREPLAGRPFRTFTDRVQTSSFIVL